MQNFTIVRQTVGKQDPLFKCVGEFVNPTYFSNSNLNIARMFITQNDTIRRRWHLEEITTLRDEFSEYKVENISVEPHSNFLLLTISNQA